MAREAHEPELIDQIYESSLVSELWPNVLRRLANVAAARTGFLFIANGDVNHWATSRQDIAEVVAPLVKSGMIPKSERFRRLLTARHSGFLTEKDLYTDEELASDPFYRGFLFPRGLGWAAATAVSLPTGDRFIITLEREHRLGPVEPSAIEALDELRPHVA
jgi:hypothetical protein